MPKFCNFCVQNLSLPSDQVDGDKIMEMLEELDPSFNVSHRTASKICQICWNELITACNLKQKYREAIEKFHEKYQSETDEFKNTIDTNMDDNESKCNVMKTSPEIHSKVVRIPGGKKKRPFECHICLRRFSLKGLYGTHVERHETKEKQHRCMKCGLKFLCKAHFKEHKCRNVKKKAKPCIPSMIEDNANKDDKNSIEISVIMLCPEKECEFKTKCIDELNKHLEVVHPYFKFPEIDPHGNIKKEKDLSPDSAQLVFTSMTYEEHDDILSRKSITNSELKHERENNETEEHIDQQNNLLGKISTNSSSGFPMCENGQGKNNNFPCDECDNSFSSFRALRIHKTRKHKLHSRKKGRKREGKQSMSPTSKKPKKELPSDESNEENTQELEMGKLLLPECEIPIDRSMELDALALKMTQKLKEEDQISETEEMNCVEVATDDAIEYMDAPVDNPVRSNNSANEDTKEVAERISTVIQPNPIFQKPIDIPQDPDSKKKINIIEQIILTPPREQPELHCEQTFNELQFLEPTIKHFVIDEEVECNDRSYVENVKKILNNMNDRNGVEYVSNSWPIPSDEVVYIEDSDCD